MKTPIVTIGGIPFGHGFPTRVIAEAGINHNGSVASAKDLAGIAKKCGCVGIKFQKRTVATVYTEEELRKPREVNLEMLINAVKRGVLSPDEVGRLKSSNFENSTNGDLKYALELTEAEYHNIDECCQALDLMWFASCWDEESVDFISTFDPPCFKIASASLTDDDLLRHTRSKGKPIILSTGMSDLSMIKHAVEVLGTENLILMHCTSFYPPATLEKVSDYGLHLLNLKAMETLRNEFGVPVGYSAHDTGIIPSYTAAVLGACAVEVHLTKWRGAFGSDQASSLEPSELERLCRMIDELPRVLGDGIKRFYDEEKPVAKKLRRK